MKNLRSAILGLFFIAALSGCVSSDVTRFHSLPARGSGQPVFITHANPALASSIEFRSYVPLVENELRKAGYSIAGGESNADYVALIDYSIDGGKTGTSSYPISGRTGGGTTYHSGSVTGYGGGYGTYSGYSYTAPTYGVVGHQTYSYTTYGRFLSLTIIEKPRSPDRKPKPVFEGKVTSEGSSNQLPRVMPGMVKALFEGFPGQSGKSYSTTIAAE